MKNYKQELSERLSEAVRNIHDTAVIMYYEESEDGFYCDYAMPPISPGIFAGISRGINTDGISCAFETREFSGVYEDGDASKQVLQRIYVTAFPTQDELDAHKYRIAEASKRDHRSLGRDMKLFSGSNDIGQGLSIWHPKGAMLRYMLESFGQAAHILNDYQWVYSPHIGRSELWKISGHLDFYKDSMYSPIDIDGDEYYLKPMNCPFHINIYNSEIHSYRDLPIKYAEYGTVYRYELSGALNGLTRVRGFTQDDAHIICTPEQIEQQVSEALKFSLYILRSFGLDDFVPYISTKPDKSIGKPEEWEMATEVLKRAVVSAGLEYSIDEGGGVFYGPKIDIKLKDCLGREWQCSTIQFDFNLPNRFNMFYIGSDGQRHTPCMVHRALFGSLERFIALLIEHYNGEFPLWFTPVQFGIVPIKASHNDYVRALKNRLCSHALRASVDDSDENMRNKIRRFEMEKVPYILVVGDKEVASQRVSVRSRSEGDLGSMDMPELIEHLRPQLDLGKPCRIID